MRLYYKDEEAEVDRTVAAHPKYQKVAVPNGFIITQIQPDLEKAKDVAAAYAFDMVNVQKDHLVGQIYVDKDEAIKAAIKYANELDQLRYVIRADVRYVQISANECFVFFGEAPQNIASLVYTATPTLRHLQPRSTYPIFQTMEAAADYGGLSYNAVKVPNGWISTKLFTSLDKAEEFAQGAARDLERDFLVIRVQRGHIVIRRDFYFDLFGQRWYDEDVKIVARARKADSIDWRPAVEPNWFYHNRGVSAYTFQNPQVFLGTNRPAWEWMVIMSVTETVLEARTPGEQDVNVTSYRKFSGAADTSEDAKQQAEECIAKHQGGTQ